MSTSFTLHVGCPYAAARSDTYTFVDNTNNTTTLTFNQIPTAIATVTFTSLSQALPFTCQILSTYSDIDILSYIDYTENNRTAPTLSQT